MAKKKIPVRRRMARNVKFLAKHGSAPNLTEEVYRSQTHYLSNATLGSWQKGDLFRKESTAKDFGSRMHEITEWMLNNEDNRMAFSKEGLTPDNAKKMVACADSFSHFMDDCKEAPFKTEIAYFADWDEVEKAARWRGPISLKYFLAIRQWAEANYPDIKGFKVKLDIELPDGLSNKYIHLNGRTIVDPKSATEESIHGIKQKMLSYSYDRQRWFYSLTYCAVTGFWPTFLFLFLFKQKECTGKYLLIGEENDRATAESVAEKYLSYGFYKESFYAKA